MGPYSKVEEPCFVCQIEDDMGQERGTQSHPFNCGWRVIRENKNHIKTLEQIYNICQSDKSSDDKLKEIKNNAIQSLVARYDMKDEVI